MRDSKIASSVALMLIFKDLLLFHFTNQRINSRVRIVWRGRERESLELF
jgi:hypothetical protein